MVIIKRSGVTHGTSLSYLFIESGVASYTRSPRVFHATVLMVCRSLSLVPSRNFPEHRMRCAFASKGSKVALQKRKTQASDHDQEGDCCACRGTELHMFSRWNGCSSGALVLVELAINRRWMRGAVADGGERIVRARGRSGRRRNRDEADQLSALATSLCINHFSRDCRCRSHRRPPAPSTRSSCLCCEHLVPASQSLGHQDISR